MEASSQELLTALSSLRQCVLLHEPTRLHLLSRIVAHRMEVAAKWHTAADMTRIVKADGTLLVLVPARLCFLLDGGTLWGRSNEHVDLFFIMLRLVMDAVSMCLIDESMISTDLCLALEEALFPTPASAYICVHSVRLLAAEIACILLLMLMSLGDDHVGARVFEVASRLLRCLSRGAAYVLSDVGNRTCPISMAWGALVVSFAEEAYCLKPTWSISVLCGGPHVVGMLLAALRLCSLPMAPSWCDVQAIACLADLLNKWLVAGTDASKQQRLRAARPARELCRDIDILARLAVRVAGTPAGRAVGNVLCELILHQACGCRGHWTSAVAYVRSVLSADFATVPKAFFTHTCNASTILMLYCSQLADTGVLEALVSHDGGLLSCHEAWMRAGMRQAKRERASPGWVAGEAVSISVQLLARVSRAIVVSAPGRVTVVAEQACLSMISTLRQVRVVAKRLDSDVSSLLLGGLHAGENSVLLRSIVLQLMPSAQQLLLETPANWDVCLLSDDASMVGCWNRSCRNFDGDRETQRRTAKCGGSCGRAR